MEELIRDVETAFHATSKILVSGDAVDALALIRVKLRNVHVRLKEIKDDIQPQRSEPATDETAATNTVREG